VYKLVIMIHKACISSVAMKLAKNINKHLGHVIISAAFIQLEIGHITDESSSSLSCKGQESKSYDKSKLKKIETELFTSY